MATSPLLGGEMTVNIHRYRWKELLEISSESKFESNRLKAIEATAPQKWCCTVEGVEGGGGGAGVGQVCAPTIATNVRKILQLAELQLRLFPLPPPDKKTRLKIVLKTYFSCQFSIGCCTGHIEVVLKTGSIMFWGPNLDPVPCSTS